MLEQLTIKGRTIYLTGEINELVAGAMIVSLEFLDSSLGDIRIVLNSQGGEEPSGYMMYDAITMCKNKVIIDGYGEISSIAAAIFQAGDVRRMSPNATFMIHNGSIPIETDNEDFTTQDKIIALADRLKKDNQRYYNILSAGSYKPVEIIKEWCQSEEVFTSEEAVDVGFADEVIKPFKTRSIPKPTKRKKK